MNKTANRHAQRVHSAAIFFAGNRGLTAEECQTQLPDIPPNSVRSRLSELTARGKIIKTTEVRRNQSGFGARVYVIR